MERNIKILDKEYLRDVILDFPKQFSKGYELAANASVRGNFEAVEISGMGGSSLPANLLRIYLSEKNLSLKGKDKGFHVFQNRFYDLPHEAYENALNIFSSYSGNTEETVSSLKEAIKNKLPSIGIATGGEIEKLCRKYNMPLVMLPSGIQPRYATGYFFGSLIRVLENSGIMTNGLPDLKKRTKNLEEKMQKLEMQGKKLAKIIAGKTPVIYSSTKFKALAMIWKIKINENAKTPAFWNFFSEMNHNEMVGFTLPQSKFHVIILMDKKDHPQNVKRMKITSKLLQKKGTSATIIEITGKDIFDTIFSTVLLGDWTSYYLALEYGQDPTPVAMVEDLKKMLKK